MSNKGILVVVIFGLIAGMVWWDPLNFWHGQDRAVTRLVDRNLAARGGADAWAQVESLRLTGKMDLGQDVQVPYVMEQKRPGRMCFELLFAGDKAIQCTDGSTGWKVVPFQGRRVPELMTEQELRDAADSADPYGMLYDYAQRGHQVEILGHADVDGRDTIELLVTLPKGAQRWLYIDAETGLELRMDALRTVAGVERRVETYYREWRDEDGLLIPSRQETRTVGDNEFHFLTVTGVQVNAPIDDARFMRPALLAASRTGS